MNLIEQPIKVTEWQQTYTYDSGIHSGANTGVPSVSSKGIMEDEEACGRQYTVKKTTTYTQGAPQCQGWGLTMGIHPPAENRAGPWRGVRVAGGRVQEPPGLRGRHRAHPGRRQILLREPLEGGEAQTLPVRLKGEAQTLPSVHDEEASLGDLGTVEIRVLLF